MEYIRIKNTEQPLFTQAWQLYEKSFPPEERRLHKSQEKIMGSPLYHFESILDDSLFVGIVLWWNFDHIKYIEHLATAPHIRGKGYGLRILQKFINESNVPILLEIEHPVDNISIRRAGFYQRAGFIMNSHNYTHPPYMEGGKNVSLKLMTHPNAITDNELQYFLEECHPVIHEFYTKPR